MILLLSASSFFFFNDTATTEIYTLSLHDALPISLIDRAAGTRSQRRRQGIKSRVLRRGAASRNYRSEEHTSELQSHLNLVCRLLLEKKKKTKKIPQKIRRERCRFMHVISWIGS